MIIRLIRYLRGYVKVNIKGFFIEKFLNECAKNNILLWNIKHTKNNLVTACMTIGGFRKIRRDAYKTCTEIKIFAKCGLPFYLHKNKNRKALIPGILIAVLMFLCLTSFIWAVEIEGNEMISDEEIITLLSECEFKTGIFRYNIDVEKIKNEVLKKTDRLSWIWVEINGTRAVVNVREKKEAPPVFDKAIPSNIVANRDGLVTSVVATTGQKVVKEGDIVTKGDLLISGVLESSVSGYKYVNSSGSVKARTWYEKEAQTSLIKTEFIKTDKKISKNTVNLFGFDVLLYIDDNIKFAHYEKDEKNHQLSLGKNTPLPFKLNRKIYWELKKKETKLTLADAVKECSDNLKKEIENELKKDTQIVKKDVFHTQNEDGTINVKVVYECIEDISENVMIDT